MMVSPTTFPREWRRTRLDAVGTVLTGSTPPTQDRSNYGHDRMFASPADLGRSKYVASTAKMLSMRGFARSRRVPAGSTLFVCIGSTIGKVGLASDEMATNQQINTIVPDNGVDGEYIYYAAATLSAHVREQAGVQAVPLVNKTMFSAFEIPLPPLKEQRAIASALADADGLIATLERLIAKKKTIERGMMQQLLTGRTRLLGFVSPWKQVEIGALLEFKNGLNKASKFFGSGTPIVNFMDVMHGPIITAADLKGRVALTREEIKRFSAKRNDIFFTRTSETVDEVGTAAVLVDDVPDASFSGFILRGRPRSKDCDAQFLAHLFQVDSVRRQVTSGATYTTRALTNGRSLSRVVVHIPSVDEQRVIAQTLTDVEDEIAALRSRLNKASAVKQGMMQQLLTGKIRPPVGEVA